MRGPFGPRHWARAAAAAGLAAASVLTMAGPARAAIPAGSEYVALGSSIAAGPALAPIVDTGCMRSGSNYPSLVAQRLSLKLDDVSCSAATTANVLSTPQQTSTGAKPPQIDAVGPDTRLVTASIGGNDLEYVGRLTANSCANTPVTFLPGVCQSLAGQPSGAPSDSAYTGVENRLVQIVQAARSRAPQATVALVDYLPVLDPNNRNCPLTPLTDAQWTTSLRVAEGLAAATARAASRTGAVLVRASAAGASHTPCSSDPWMNGFQLSNPLDGPIQYHATHDGMAGVAQEVVNAIG